VHAAHNTAMNPTNLFLFAESLSSLLSSVFDPELCTIATPIVNTN